VPLYGGRHVPAHSSSIGGPKPKRPPTFVPLGGQVCRYPYGPPHHERVVGDRGTHAYLAVLCGMNGSRATTVSFPLFYSDMFIFSTASSVIAEIYFCLAYNVLVIYTYFYGV